MEVAKELQRVRDFIQRAETLPRDSKADKLLEVMRIIGERPPERRRVVIFTESLLTQDYIQKVLLERGGYAAEAITLFPRHQRLGARQPGAGALAERGRANSFRRISGPAATVAVRLALVHEFKTRSQVFISTEAGAKGLNLQFCDTIINYDLPWNPQRIEQRIGRCHRYGQQHDVTVINFLASDNEAQQLTFEILSRKLDLVRQGAGRVGRGAARAFHATRRRSWRACWAAISRLACAASTSGPARWTKSPPNCAVCASRWKRSGKSTRRPGRAPRD